MCSQVLMRQTWSEMPFCSCTRAIPTTSGFHLQSHLWYEAELFMYYLTGIQKKCITEGFAGCHLCIHNEQKKVGMNFMWEEQRKFFEYKSPFQLLLYMLGLFFETHKNGSFCILHRMSTVCVKHNPPSTLSFVHQMEYWHFLRFIIEVIMM